MDSASDRRRDLLDRIVEDLLKGGVADLSLRPLAERVGTSARLLIYHFESREALLAAALNKIRERVARALKAKAAQTRPTTLRALLLMFWEWAAEDANQPYFRVLFEVDGLYMFGALRLSEASRREGGAVWLSLLEGAAARLPDAGKRGPERATLIMAALNGLLQDLLSTGDKRRTTAALNDLMDLVETRRRAPTDAADGKAAS